MADSFQFGLERQKIEWEYTPLTNQWNLISRLWEKMIENVYDWLDSFGSFCTTRLSLEVSKRHQLHHAQYQTYTGMQSRHTKSKGKYLHGLFPDVLDDIFEHETYLTAYDAKQIWYSDQTLELIKKPTPIANPLGKPNSELISEAEENIFHKKLSKA